MGWSDEAEQGFPPQRHREPSALRQEILDELADHLALATERESESGAEDDRQIRTRVLKKFGNPAAIARALWWDAMKGTIMKDWIQISINAVICVVVVGFMSFFYRQMQSTNAALIDALNDRPIAVELRLPSVEFVFHRGSIEGPPAEGIEVNLNGKAFNDDPATIKEKSDARGRARFGPIHAGQYTIRLIDTRTGLMGVKVVTLYSNEEFQTVHIAVPPTTPAALDVKSPLAQYAASEDVQLSMFMNPQWSYGDDTWYGVGRFVLVTSEGVFNTVLYSRRGDIIRPEERLTQTYGNRLLFNSMNLRRSHYPDESGTEWFKRLERVDDPYFSSYNTASDSHDVQLFGTNTIVLDLPVALLEAYGYHVRLSENSKHGLPERFSWFPEPTTEEYSDFVIDEARLVEESLAYTLNQDRYDLSPGKMHITVTGQTGHLFSLKNAPRSLPDRYRLILALHDPQREIHELNANLCAYLDTSSAPYGIEEPVANLLVEQIREPVWRLGANSIDSTASDALFVDLTDAINDDTNFEKATGILFMWDAPSKNKIRFGSPETASDSWQPVWLIMKPSAPPSNANAVPPS